MAEVKAVSTVGAADDSAKTDADHAGPAKPSAPAASLLAPASAEAAPSALAALVPKPTVAPAGPVTTLVPEYGVVHIRNALTEAEQQALWRVTKPRCEAPTTRACGLSCFCVSEKNSRAPRTPEFDAYGHKVFQLAASELLRKLPAPDGADRAAHSEPSYQHLLDIAAGEPVRLDEVRGNVYRPDASLFNHCDCDQILFSMSVSLGDDCEFVIGNKTGRTARMSERSGKPRTLRLRSGDALFFDGGLVPHHVTRMLPGTAPAWWAKEKVTDGSRCVVLFREAERNFMKERVMKKKNASAAGAAAAGAPPA